MVEDLVWILNSILCFISGGFLLGAGLILEERAFAIFGLLFFIPMLFIPMIMYRFQMLNRWVDDKGWEKLDSQKGITLGDIIFGVMTKTAEKYGKR